MASEPTLGGQFSIGRVFSGMIEPIVANCKILLGFSAVVQLAISGLGVITISQTIAYTDNIDPADPMSGLAIFRNGEYWLVFGATLLLHSFAQVGIMRACLDHQQGNEIGLSRCFSTAIAGVLPYFGLAILWLLSISFGFGLLIIPGLILVSMWAVAAPAIVAEDVSIPAAFGRSRTLTKNSRMVVFATLLLFGIAYYFVMLAMQGFSQTFLIDLYKRSTGLAFVYSFIVGSLSALIVPAFLASLYRETRLVTEGVGPRGLGDVFA